MSRVTNVCGSAGERFWQGAGMCSGWSILCWCHFPENWMTLFNKCLCHMCTVCSSTASNRGLTVAESWGQMMALQQQERTRGEVKYGKYMTGRSLSRSTFTCSNLTCGFSLNKLESYRPETHLSTYTVHLSLNSTATKSDQWFPKWEADPPPPLCVLYLKLVFMFLILRFSGPLAAFVIICVLWP